MPEPADLTSQEKYYIEVNPNWLPDSSLDFIDFRVRDIGIQLRSINSSLASEIAMYRKSRPEPVWSNLMTFLGLVLALQETMTEANQSHKGSTAFLDQSIIKLDRTLEKLKSEVDRAKRRRTTASASSQASTSPIGPSQTIKINTANPGNSAQSTRRIRF